MPDVIFLRVSKAAKGSITAAAKAAKLHVTEYVRLAVAEKLGTSVLPADGASVPAAQLGFAYEGEAATKPTPPPRPKGGERPKRRPDGKGRARVAKKRKPKSDRGAWRKKLREGVDAKPKRKIRRVEAKK